MIAIITGDIINSEDHKAAVWVGILRNYLSGLGTSPSDWEIYRGDEFQIKIAKEEALQVAIHIKALIKTVKGLDVRMGIGVGAETYLGNGVSESNGPAYQRSGRTFENLKDDKNNLTIATGNESYDQTLNLMVKLALDFMDDWSTVSAEIIAKALQDPHASQQEIAEQLNIQQSAVSQRQKRARLHLVKELLNYYTSTIQNAAT